MAIVLTVAACGGGGAIAHERPANGATPGAKEATRITLPRSIDDGGEGGVEVPYDHVVQKSIHNAYERSEPLLDQLVYHRARSLELDVHVARQGTSAPPGEWFVFHEDNPFMQETSCLQLSDCLALVAAFHRSAPKHEVVTLFVDLKDEPDAGHGASDLDEAFVRALGRDAIVTPGDLVAACPGAKNVREAVTGRCSFPTLRALRGKFILATTGGTACNAASNVAAYAAGNAAQRVAFVAPNVDTSCPVAAYQSRPNVVFFNMSASERARAAEVKALGLVARVYGGGSQGGLDEANAFLGARRSGAVHLATDKVSFEHDGWSTTHRRNGFPFACEGCEGAVEAGDVLGVRAASGDQWGRSDSGFFALENESGDMTWQALVSVPSSHAEPFAKACLVARASDEPNAVSVAVCRPFDANPPRLQVRSTTGATTTAIEAERVEGFSAETPAFLRLAVHGREVTAFASTDAQTWATIGSVTVAAPLPVRGVSVSSKGMKAKALFANLVRGASDTALAHVSASTLRAKAIGRGASGDVFDGVFAP